MKKNRFTLLMAAVIGICLTASAQKTDMKYLDNPKTLVAYFSATGTTAEAARKLAGVTGGELFEIAPATPYTDADLDWHDKQSRSSVEMNDPKSRPALKGKKANMAAYEVVYIGYPIWWGVAPTIVKTFIESHELKGKTVIPFATSGGSGIDQSITDLKKTYPDLDWKEGRLLSRINEKTIREWTEGLMRQR